MCVRPDGPLDGFVCMNCTLDDFADTFAKGYAALYAHLRRHRDADHAVPRKLLDGCVDAMRIEVAGQDAIRRELYRDGHQTYVNVTRVVSDLFVTRDLALRVGSVSTVPVTDDEDSWWPADRLMMVDITFVPGLRDGFRLSFVDVLRGRSTFDLSEFLDDCQVP